MYAMLDLENVIYDSNASIIVIRIDLDFHSNDGVFSIL